jgi:Zn-dependent protease
MIFSNPELFIKQLVISLPVILFAITIHEYAHGWVADKLGDPTARMMGRLTLNPVAHIDPIGFLMLIIARFGWAKPVPVNPRNLANPRRDMLLIAVAGPVSNVAAALLFSILFRALRGQLGGEISLPLRVGMLLVIWGIVINLALAVFNLIPIPPLDGSKILAGILPPRQAYQYETRVGPYGGMILMGLLLLDAFTQISIIGTIMSPFLLFFARIFTGHSPGYLYGLFYQLMGF